jgi:hypothetical protein
MVSHGQVYAGPPPPPNGPGYALSFDGVNDHLTATPANLPTGNSAYTIEAWMRPNTMHVGAFAAWGTYGNPNQVNAFVLDVDGLVNYWWGNDLKLLTPNLAGAWHHVAATFDGTTRRIILDGVSLTNDTPVGHAVTAANFRIGLANVGQYFNGQLDEVRIWNVARTTNQIQEAMRRQLLGTESGLVANWRLDEGAGLSALDATGNDANVATLVNGPGWVVSTTLPFAPTVSTLPAVNGPAGSATLHGAAMFNGAVTTEYFQWGTSTNYGNVTATQSSGTGSGSNTWSAVVSGLSRGVVYHYRAVATNAHGPSYGADRTFGYGLTNVVSNTADSGPGSLRQTILEAAPEDTIVFAPWVTGALTLTSGELVLNRNVTLLGPGPQLLAISGNNVSRVFNVIAGTNLIAGLTIRDGLASSPLPLQSAGGGAILNNAVLAVSNCVFTGNRAVGINGAVGEAGGGALGGAIYNRHQLTLVNSTFMQNRAQGGAGGNGANNTLDPGQPGGFAWGGAVYATGPVTILNCTFADNTAAGGAGGPGGYLGGLDLYGPGGAGGDGFGGHLLFETQGSTNHIIHATLAGGRAEGGAGGRGDTGPGPGAAGAGSGGGVRCWFTTTRMLNTVVAGNQLAPVSPSNGADVSGGIASLGHNFVSVTNGSSGWTQTDLTGSANALLNPLANNGGPTPTLAPQPGSPVVDAGDDASLSAPYSLTTDQRGFPRRAGSHVDIGAVELAVAQLSAVSSTQPWLVMAGPNNFFMADAAVLLNGSSPAGTPIELTVAYELRDETNGVVLLRSNSVSRIVTLPAGGSTTVVVPLPLAPSAPLDSVNHTYRVLASLSHVAAPGGPGIQDNALSGPLQRLFYFTGRLTFGSVETTFTQLSGSPVLNSVASSLLLSALPVAANAGYLNARPTHTYSGPLASVTLFSNGDAVYGGASSVPLTGPSPDTDAAGNIRFTRSATVLSTGGASGTVQVRLPTGFGITPSRTSRVLTSALTVNFWPLDGGLVPLGSVPLLSTSGSGCEESKPFWIGFGSLSWDVAAGRINLHDASAIEFVRFREYQALNNWAGLVDIDAAQKKSNDNFYRTLSAFPAGGQVFVEADANGAAQLSARLAIDGFFGPYADTCHFPYGARIAWSAGTLVITNDLVDTATSHLLPTDDISLNYYPDCLGAACGEGSTNGSVLLSLTPAAGQLNFTRDGGLVAEGAVGPNPSLSWGSLGPSRFVQSAWNLGYGAFAAAGTFLRGGQTTLPIEDRPGVILHSGFSRPGNPAYIERPGTPEYQAGLANYAGVNLRNSGSSGTSILAGQTVPTYPLRPNSKYYARYGGVSGVHEPVPFAITNLTLYGYDFSFSSFGVSYLDNHVHESLINGSVKVPYPSGFTQSFAGLTLTCDGALDSAEIPPTNRVLQPLQYWDGKFRTLAMDFEGSDPCNPASKFLVLGVETYAAYVPKPLYGRLGFKNTGNLVTLGDTAPPFGGTGVDSRLELPPNLTLHGPPGQTYALTTVGRAYLNNHDDLQGGPGTGFINFAGRLNVPFFADLPVHVHTKANTNDTNATFHLMGGWPAREADLTSYGWREPANAPVGRHYFNTPAVGKLGEVFDARNRGFPPLSDVASLDAYRDNLGPNYHPRAQQSWVGFVNFDLPLKWDPVLRIFTEFEPQSTGLLLVTVDGQVRRMDALTADLTFGAELSALPKISLGNLAFSALNSAFPGISRALDNALAQVGGSTSDLLGGVTGLDRLMNARPDGWFAEMLNSPTKQTQILDDIADGLYLELTGGGRLAGVARAASPPPIGGDVGTVVSYWIQTILQDRLDKEIADTGAGKLIYDITNTLGEVDKTLETIVRIVGPDEQIVFRLVHELVSKEAAPWLGYLSQETINGAIRDARPTLDDIVARMNQVRGYIAEVHNKLRDGQEFQKELLAIVGDRTGGVCQRAADEINRYLTNLPSMSSPSGEQGRPAVAVPASSGLLIPEAEFKALVKRQIAEQLAFSPIGADVQVAIKQRLQDPAFVIRSAIDSVFQQVNRIIRDALSSAIADLVDDSNFIPYSGALASGGAAAKLNGYAHLNGDTLEKLRLDGRFELKVPDKMRFDAYMEFAQRESSSFPDGCRPPGETATEIALGADNVPLEWVSPGTRASVGTKFTMADGGLSGFSGSIDIKGGIELEVIEINELAAVIGFGIGRDTPQSPKYLREAYFGARARARLNAYEVAGGVWFGKACDSLPLKIIDPMVEEILPKPGPYIGGYAYAEGWLPVNEWLGIPSTCLFTVRGGIGAGMFFFETGQPPVRTFGGKALIGADITLLCIAHARLAMRLVGAKSGGDFILRGRGDVDVEIGECPFCIEFSKSVGIKMVNGDADVDF